MKEITINGIRYYTQTNGNECLEDLQLVQNEDDVCILKLSLDFKGKVPENYMLCWEEFVPNAYGFWEPMCRFTRNVMPDWAKRCALSKTAYNAPLAVLFSSNDQSCIAVSISDIYNGVEIKSGVCEETAKHSFEIHFFALSAEPTGKYQTFIRIDRRRQPFAQAIENASNAWREWGCTDAPVPIDARKPVYSTWYNFHQNINPDEILEELKIAKQLGFETVIVDDGWQTDDVSRGYGYCGDWEVCQKKIPDMKKFVDDVHTLGMKFVIWYAVPFMGIYSKQYERFKGKYLYYNEGHKASALDPRFKEVREYLVDLYGNAAKMYGYDGFKLDFIDSMYLTKDSSTDYEAMDCISVEEGVKKLLAEIGERLRAQNPNVLIEFRQGYFGPGVTSLGNMIRVSDCPADGLSNRVGGLDLKMTIGNAATHSDMLLWEDRESVVAVAKQLLDILFVVPQLSVKLAHLPKTHIEYIKGYLDFRTKHADTIDFGKLTVKGVGANYTQAIIEKDEKIVVCYTDPVVTVDHTMYAFNATSTEKLYLDFGTIERVFTVYDTAWKKVDQAKGSGIIAVNVPRCGYVKIDK